jgi:hypothetical protein
MTTDQRIENLEKGLASARRFNRWLPTCAVGLALGVWFLAGTFGPTMAAAPGGHAAFIGKVTVTAEQAPVMSAKDTLLLAKKGDVFNVTAVNGDWYGLAPSRGWIHKSNVSYQPLSAATVNKEALQAAASQEEPSAGANERIVDALAAQWAVQYGWISEKENAGAEVIELAVFGQAGTVEQRMALYTAFANSKMPVEKQQAMELISLKRRSQGEYHRLVVEMQGMSYKMNSSEAAAKMIAMLTVVSLRQRLIIESQTSDVMSPELASAIAKTEVLTNKNMTSEQAAGLVKFKADRAGSLTQEDQKAMNEFVILLNEQITPARAAFIVKATAALEAAKTKELEESRARVKCLLREALAKEAGAEKAFVNAGDVAKQATSEELLRSRKQVESRIEEAKKK